MHSDMWHIGAQHDFEVLVLKILVLSNNTNNPTQIPPPIESGDSRRSSYINFNIIDLLPKTLLLKTVFSRFNQRGYRIGGYSREATGQEAGLVKVDVD